jgi:hypothetical protein
MDGRKVDEMKGADPNSLQSMVSKYVAMIPQSFTGSGFSLGGNTGNGYCFILFV